MLETAFHVRVHLCVRASTMRVFALHLQAGATWNDFPNAQTVSTVCLLTKRKDENQPRKPTNHSRSDTPRFISGHSGPGTEGVGWANGVSAVRVVHTTGRAI